MTIKTRDVIRISLVVLAIYLAVQFLWFAHTLVFVTFLGILFGVALTAGVNKLHIFKIPRGVGAALITLTFLGLLATFVAWIGPTTSSQYGELREQLPTALEKLDNWIADKWSVNGSEPPSITQSIVKRLGGVHRYLFPVLSSTLAAVSGFILVIFLAVYMAVDPGTYRRGLLALIPTESRNHAEVVIADVVRSLRRWLTTQLIAMLVIGTVTTIVLFMLDVRAALPLGILAGILEFVPTVGPILSAIPAVAMGFVESPEKALIIGAAYVAIQFLENQLLIPMLMKEGVDIPPVLTILMQAAMALMFGFMGLFVAVPLLVVVMVVIRSYLPRSGSI
jgi:predicted PurR-regulated permease PerM